MKCEVKVSRDKMKASVILRDDGAGYDLTSDDILKALKESGVRYGILYEDIKKIVERAEFDKPYVVAVGKKPIHGCDGKIEIYQREVAKTKEKDRVDFREMAAKKKRRIVKKGDVIGKFIKPSPGVPGMDVYGNPVKPRPGKPAPFRIGAGISVERDGTLVAEKGGMLVARGNEIHIEDMLIIKGDVDYSTGNINFPGFVEINGDVKSGFVVKAKNDIVIRGIVEAATVISFEGSVEVMGVKGKEKGLIRAKQDVRAKFLENAHVEADNVVEVEGPITNSNVKAKEKVLLKGKKGVLVGGVTMASKIVEAEEIGSPLGVRTVVEIGIDPEIREKEKILNAQIKLDEENLNKLLFMLRDLKRLKDMKGSLPEDKEETYKKISQTIMYLKSMIDQNKKELFRIRREYSNFKKEAKIIARKILYPGVEVVMLQKRLSISNPISKAVIVIDEKKDEIVVEAYTGS